jgi:predicted transcriptional regulator YheO
MNPFVERYVPLVTFLGETLPEACEIMLFDLTEKNVPLAAQRNARRTAAEPVRRYLRLALSSKTVVDNGMLTNRADVMGRERLDKTSILLIKDEDGQPVGALVLSMDLTAFLPMQAVFQNLLTFNGEELEEIRPRQEEAPPETPTLDTIDRMVAEFTADPERMTIDEKTELILDLYDEGVFELKGAVARAAFSLNMSQQSIYRYLAKIKRLRGE